MPLERFVSLDTNISELGEKLHYYVFKEKLRRSLECGTGDGKRCLNDAAINSISELGQKIEKARVSTS